MTKKNVQQLLQMCLDGYEAGMTPEECLTAHPAERAELEPLFRQALSLRVAFAAAPRAEFRAEARERLLTAAGRDVTHAFAAEPDPQFVESTRRRLLNRAGAEAQEALRDIPPPRLPFWANTRRHLLETASSTPPKPVAHPARVRTLVSAAVVVIAMTVAGAGFFISTSTSESPRTASAELDLEILTQRVGTIEQMRDSGQAVSPNLLDEVAILTTKLLEQFPGAEEESELKAKLPTLIERTRVIAAALPQGESLDQSLASADEVLAAAEPTATAAPTETTEPAATATEEAVAVVEPTATTEATDGTPEAEPTATTEPEIEIPVVTLVQPEDLAADQVAIQYDPNFTAMEERWWRVTTSSLTFVIPETWSITNLDQDENGLAILPESSMLLIETDVADAVLAVHAETGQVILTSSNETLRTPGGALIEPDALASLLDDDDPDGHLAVFLMLTSVDVVETATPTPTVEPAPTETSTPVPATSTPEATTEPDSGDSE